MNVTTSFSNHSKKRRGFSLTELIAVMGIMGLLIAVSAPAISSLARAQGTTSAAYQIKDYLDFARNYAVSNQTLVRVGIKALDETQTVSGKPALVVHAIKNYEPASSVNMNFQDSGGDYLYWNDLARPLVLENVEIPDLSVNYPVLSALGTELGLSTPELLSFSREINGVSSNVTFDRTLVISKNGEFCVGSDTTDSTGAPLFHDSYPTRGIYFGLGQVAGGDENEVAISLHGVSGRVQIYRKGDLLAGGDRWR